MKNHVFLDVMPCNPVEIFHRFGISTVSVCSEVCHQSGALKKIYSANEDSKFFTNSGKFLPHYMASYPRRQHSRENLEFHLIAVFL